MGIGKSCARSAGSRGNWLRSGSYPNASGGWRSGPLSFWQWRISAANEIRGQQQTREVQSMTPELRHIFNVRALVPVANANTDDRGEFRLSGLDANDYYIRILPPRRTERY